MSLQQASKDDIKFIKKYFVDNYTNAQTELNYTNDYELLIAIILSAQCTDKRVNIITPALFKAYPNTKKLSEAKYEDVVDLIKTCSFFANKAKHIIAMAQRVESKFGGVIPQTAKELVTLAGVGSKTANVFLIEGKGANLMAVDTHVFRVSHRLGLSYAKTVEQTSKELEELLMDEHMSIYHQAMVLFGRYKCKALNPICGDCELVCVCKSKSRFKV